MCNSKRKNAKSVKSIRASLLLLSVGAMTLGSPVKALAESVSEPLAEVTSVQQQNKVVITVVDDQNEPIIGASVILTSTNGGAVTDLSGQCIINASPGDEIKVSYIGYVTQKIKLGKSSSQKIVLLEDRQSLDEVVVVGYGTMRKSDLTGSSSTTRGTDILKGQGFNALEGLKGKSAGVNIFNNTGQPGGEMRVIIRGIATINASASPLYIVDGVAMTDFQYLNPNDIESIEVLKDASSAAIYGARGANGVIMVTTKRGNAGKGAHVKYDGSVSVSNMARKMEIMNASEWMSAFKQGLENANEFQGMNFDTDLSKIFIDSRYFVNGNPIYDTDWQDECARTAVSHNHQLSIQRTGENGSSIGAFLNYTDQEGIMLNTYHRRINAKFAYDDNPTKWLSTSVNLLVNHSWGNHTSDNPYGQGAMRTMIELYPWLPVQLNGEYIVNDMVNTASILKDKDDPNSGLQGLTPEGVGNPVEFLERIEDMQYKTQIFGNAALTFHLAKGLDLKTQFGVDYHNNRYKLYAPFQPHEMKDRGAPEGEARAENNNTFYWQEETYLTYIHDFDKHHLNAMAGASWQAYKYDNFGAWDSHFSDDYYGYYNLGKGTQKPSVWSGYDKWAMNSYFLRLAYNYSNRYMATVTGRYDGSSKFGENNKYAFFPSVGLGWLVSNEEFMENVKPVSKLKLHTSFGMTGNSEIGTYRSLSTVSQGTTILGGKMTTVSYLDKMPNSNLKWEKTAQWDLGFELGLFNNRLNFDVSYYYKYTSDLLLSRPVPESTGYSSIEDNIGAVSNHGFDILITAYPIQTRDFQWTTTLNMGFNKNKVEKLDEGASVDPVSGKRQILTDGFVGYDMIIREGESLSSFFGYKRAGIYDGVPEHWDPNTMNIPSIVGEKVTYKERQILGNGLPEWMGSFINTFNYKNFDLTLDLQFSLGADIMQEYYHSTVARFLTNGLDRIYEEAWHPTKNPNGQEQALRLNNFGMGANNQADSDWICNGSYLRFNLLQLGYTFESSVCKSIGINALRVYANLNNFGLICSKDYKGYDPDNSTRLGDNKWGANRQFFSYPRPRTFTFGLNVTF